MPAWHPLFGPRKEQIQGYVISSRTFPFADTSVFSFSFPFEHLKIETPDCSENQKFYFANHDFRHSKILLWRSICGSSSLEIVNALQRLSKELRPSANNFSLGCLKIQRTPTGSRGSEEFLRAERAGNISWKTYCYLSSVFEVVFLKGIADTGDTVVKRQPRKSS